MKKATNALITSLIISANVAAAVLPVQAIAAPAPTSTTLSSIKQSEPVAQPPRKPANTTKR